MSMPRIRVLQAVAGPDFSWNPGDEVDLPGEEASKWADGVRAELVRGQAAETPEGPSVETTTRRSKTATTGSPSPTATTGT
jgi:hypothetical protein